MSKSSLKKLLQAYLDIEKLKLVPRGFDLIGHVAILEIPEELKKEVNLTPGSVSIFGAINSKKVVLIIDKEVWNSDKCGFHPNINTSTLVLDHSNLEKYYNSLPNEKMILEL